MSVRERRRNVLRASRSVVGGMIAIPCTAAAVVAFMTGRFVLASVFGVFAVAEAWAVKSR